MSVGIRWPNSPEWQRWLQRLRGEVLLVLLSRMVNAAAGLIFVVITARHLGPSGRGEISFAFTIAWAATNIANLGTFTSGRLRLLDPDDPVGPRDCISLLIALLPFQALLTLTAIGLISLTSLDLTMGFSLAMVALGLATMLFQAGVVLLYGLRRYRVVLVSEVGIALVQVVAIVGVYLDGRLTTTSAILIMTAGSAVGGAWLVGQAGGFRGEANHGLTTYWRTLVVEGVYPMLGEVAMFIAFRLDRIVLAVTVGVDSLGLYVVALAIPETLRSLPKAFCQVIADRGRSGLEPASAIMQHSRRFLAGYFLALGAATAVGWVLLPVVFSEGFRSARDVLIIVTIAEAILSVHLIYQALLVGFSVPRAIGLPQVVGGLTTVALTVVMIPRWGLHGAAVACVSGYAVLAVTSGIWTTRELQKVGS
jgi:O-antigen/teichoic acid export membrane protein